MSLLWLRVALVLYSLGLAHALLTLATRRARMFAHAVTAVSLGAVFHLVSIVEGGVAASHFPATNFNESASLLAFAVTCAYLLAHWRYRFEALGLFVFPLIFMLTLAAAIGTSARMVNPVLRSGWIYLHVLLLFAGYALLFVT